MIGIREAWGDTEIKTELYGLWDTEKNDWARDEDRKPYAKNSLKEMQELLETIDS